MLNMRTKTSDRKRTERDDFSSWCASLFEISTVKSVTIACGDLNGKVDSGGCGVRSTQSEIIG